MIYAVLDNVIIMILTLISSFTSKAPELLIVSAALLMVLITYESFQEDKSRTLFALEVILMTVFAVQSGGFINLVDLWEGDS